MYLNVTIRSLIPVVRSREETENQNTLSNIKKLEIHDGSLWP